MRLQQHPNGISQHPSGDCNNTRTRTTPTYSKRWRHTTFPVKPDRGSNPPRFQVNQPVIHHGLQIVISLMDFNALLVYVFFYPVPASGNLMPFVPGNIHLLVHHPPTLSPHFTGNVVCVSNHSPDTTGTSLVAVSPAKMPERPLLGCTIVGRPLSGRYTELSFPFIARLFHARNSKGISLETWCP